MIGRVAGHVGGVWLACAILAFVVTPRFATAQEPGETDVDSLGATKPGLRLVETPLFSVDLVPLDAVEMGRPGAQVEGATLVRRVDSLGVGVLLSGSGGSGAVASVRLTAQGGLAIASEDTSFSAPLVGLVPLHRIKVSPRAQGEWVLNARATVVRDGIEQGVVEAALAVRVNGDTLVAGRRVYYRSEFIENGQRYRVSGGWWVPIDAPEEIDANDAMSAPLKPVVLRQEAARCRDCPASVRSVRLLMVVSASGAARAIPRLGEPTFREPNNPIAEECARAAVRRWVFRPARIGHTQVTDWLLVTVPIRPCGSPE